MTTGNKYPKKLKTHLQDLAKLESDLNKLAFDQKQSKTNYEKMKMQFKKENTKAKLKKRREEH